MTISKEIIDLVKIKLENCQSKVDIAKDLKISLWAVQLIHSSQRIVGRAQKVRKHTSKADLKIKQTMQAISKGGKISTTTIRRRLHSMGYCYKTVADKIVLTHNQMIRRVDNVKKWICNKIDIDQVV